MSDSRNLESPCRHETLQAHIITPGFVPFMWWLITFLFAVIGTMPWSLFIQNTSVFGQLENAGLTVPVQLIPAAPFGGLVLYIIFKSAARIIIMHTGHPVRCQIGGIRRKDVTNASHTHPHADNAVTSYSRYIMSIRYRTEPRGGKRAGYASDRVILYNTAGERIQHGMVIWYLQAWPSIAAIDTSRYYNLPDTVAAKQLVPSADNTGLYALVHILTAATLAGMVLTAVFTVGPGHLRTIMIIAALFLLLAQLTRIIMAEDIQYFIVSRFGEKKTVQIKSASHSGPNGNKMMNDGIDRSTSEHGNFEAGYFTYTHTILDTTHTFRTNPFNCRNLGKAVGREVHTGDAIDIMTYGRKHPLFLLANRFVLHNTVTETVSESKGTPVSAHV